jgi:hypothetical protein
MGAFDFSSALRGGIAGLLSGLPQGAEFVRNLRAAADQQAELAERKRQFDIEQGMRQAAADREAQQRGLENTLQLSDRGAVPVDASGRYNSTVYPDASTGIPPFSMSAPVGPNDNVVRAPGSSQRYRIPTRQEAADADLADKVKQAKAVENAKQFNLTLPGPLGEILGLPHGSTVTVEHAPGADFYTSAAGRVIDQQNADTRENAPPKTAKAEADVELTPAEQKQFGTTEKTLPLSVYKAKSEHYERVNGRAKAGDGEQKPPSAAQLRQVRSKFDSTLADSKKQLEKDLKDGWLSSEGVRQAYIDHVSRMQEAQRAYESELSTLLGKDVGHNDWADREMDQLTRGGQVSAGEQTGAPGGRGGGQKQATPQYKVGDSVNYKGKPHKVVAIENGKLVLEPAGGQ